MYSYDSSTDSGAQSRLNTGTLSLARYAPLDLEQIFLDATYFRYKRRGTTPEFYKFEYETPSQLPVQVEEIFRYDTNGILMNTNKSITGIHKYTYGTTIGGTGGTVTLSLPLQNIYLITSSGATTVRLPTVATSTGVMVTFRRKTNTEVITFGQTGGGSVIVPFNTVTAAGSASLSATQFSTSFTCDGTNWFQLQTI
jgi:hypothetical protein